MSATVLVCGKVFDDASDSLTGPAEILVEGNRESGRFPGVIRFKTVGLRLDNSKKQRLYRPEKGESENTLTFSQY